MSDADELWAAARSGDESRVEALLESGTINVNHISAGGSTALCEASEKGHAAIVARLCAANGVDLSVTDRLGWSPLHLAAYYAHADVVRTLVAHNAPLDARNADQSTPLHLAALANALDVVRILVPLVSPALLAATDARHKRPVELAADADVIAALQSPLSPSSKKPASCELCGAVKVAAKVQKQGREMWTCRPCAMSMQVASNHSAANAATTAAAASVTTSAPPPSASQSRGPPPRPKLPATARTGPSGPRPPRGGGGSGGSGVVRGAMQRAFSQELPDFPSVPTGAVSPPPPARPTRVLSPSLESSGAASAHKQAARTLSPPLRKPHEAAMGRQLPGTVGRRVGPGVQPAARRLPGRSAFGVSTVDLPSPPSTHDGSESTASTSRDPAPVAATAAVPRVSRIPLPSFSPLQSSDPTLSPTNAPPSAVPLVSGADSPSLTPNRDKSAAVLNLRVADLEGQNKRLQHELQELKHRGGGGDSSEAAVLRARVKQLEDQLDLMELALPIKSDEPSKATFDTVTAVYFKSLSKLDHATLQKLLLTKAVSSLVIDALERQRASEGETIGLAAVALVQAIASAVGKLDERGGDANKQRSVMTNRLTSSGLVSVMSQLAHLAADSSSCTVTVHRATRAVFVGMLAAGLMVRAADGGLAPVPAAADGDESRRKHLERNLSSMKFTTEAKPTEAKPLPRAPGKDEPAAAPLSPSLSSRTQYQSMPGPGRSAVANAADLPAPPKSTPSATPTLDIPRGRANGPTRTRGRRASSVEAPRFQQAAEKKAAEQRALSPARRVVGGVPRKEKKSEKTSEPKRRDLRNMGGVPTVDMEGALLLRSAQAADASGRLFADASKAIDTSFSLVNVVLLSDGHLEYRKMPTGSAQEAKEAAASLRGQSLSAVCARLLSDCVKLSEVVTTDVVAARDTAKNMIFKVRELKRVVTDVSAFAPRFGAPEDFATRCEAAMTTLSTAVANLVKLAKEELLDDTVKLDVDNRAKVSRQAVAAAMRGLLDVLPVQCRSIVTSPESTAADGAVPLEAGVVVKLSGDKFEVVLDSTSQCLFRLRDKTSSSGGLQFKSRDDDVMMEWVNAIEMQGINTVL